MSDIGTLVHKYRRRRGWTQAELVGALGRTNQTAVSHWETGRDDIGAWQRFDDLVKLFDYPADLLTLWADRELTKMEKAISRAHALKERVERRRPRTPVTKLDELIEQSRRMHSELAELRRQLSEGGEAA